MNISYNWLKEYLDFDLQPEEVSAALTSIGLETGGVDEVQTIKGGLEGLVIGEVLTCEEHPNSDHLHITTVAKNLYRSFAVPRMLQPARKWLLLSTVRNCMMVTKSLQSKDQRSVASSRTV